MSYRRITFYAYPSHKLLCRTWYAYLIVRSSSNTSPFSYLSRINEYKTCVPLMIHSAIPTVPPVAITILSWTLFCFARFRNMGTDGRTDRQTTGSKIVIATGRDCGSGWVDQYRMAPRRSTIWLHISQIWRKDHFLIDDNKTWHFHIRQTKKVITML